MLNEGIGVLAVDETWDTHHHIFDTTAIVNRFSYSPTRHLTPPKASVEQYERFKREHNFTKTVLVHGLSYGDDCSSLKTFIMDLGQQNTRGVAVINRSTTDSEIQALHDCGVRGIRLDLYREDAMRDLDKQRDILKFYATRIAPWGWSMAFLQLEPANWDKLVELIPTLPVNVIVDHQALLKASSMLPDGVAVAEQPGFTAVTRMLKADNFWIKISAPYRCSNDAPDYQDMQGLVRGLINANPKRVVFGSDWPHTPRMKVRSKEDAMRETPFLEVSMKRWLASLRRWLNDEEWQSLMKVNPKALYGW